MGKESLTCDRYVSIGVSVMDSESYDPNAIANFCFELMVESGRGPRKTNGDVGTRPRLS